MADLISVIITTYNREDALAAVLRALAQQTDKNFEAVVADDGSQQRTAATVEEWRGRVPFPLIHVWHEDRGFRASEIRNRAILASRGAYCIFLDGDCIPRPDFIAAHRRLAERGWFVTGNRILMSQELTSAVLQQRLQPEHWSFADWVRLRLRRRINRLAPLLRLRLGPLRKLRAQAWRGARSCNLAAWRADLDKVDGFDAAFSGWGREDSDLLIRLLHGGVRRKGGEFATGVLHLWHVEADRARLPRNDQELARCRSERRVRAQAGLSTLQTRMLPSEPP
ncbi:MAG TPA: glycosyltransferase family 2 protein [Xanthobacteraceae bacterium]|nr:glycosyltransferase family 2 protein [Xanthobacteraceae bacterium]